MPARSHNNTEPSWLPDAVRQDKEFRHLDGWGRLWIRGALTHDEAYLLVERPPYDLDTALPVAAEHFVFCDEPAGRQSVQTTAAQIIDAPVWHFWRD